MRGTSREEFAALLRELKTRSGRSYGALAARLHVSTSTLHRYCNGDAVPTAYAPVEQLARLCGASPEELLELHRRWLRADATRKLSAAPPQPPAAPEPEPAPVEEPGPQPASRFARFRRRLLLPGALGASLVLLLAASAVNRDDTPAARHRGDGTNLAAGQSPRPDRSAAPAPTASARPASPSPSHGKTDKSPGGGGRSAAAKSDKRGDGRTAADPVGWTVRSHLWYAGCGHTYLIGKDPAGVPPPPVQQHADTWARTQGAVHGGQTIVEAVLSPRDGQPVVITDVHVRIAGRTAPVAWNAYDMSDGCGGALSEATYTVDLDVERPVPHPQDGFDGEHTLPLAKLPYRIADDDPLALRVEANTESYDTRWYLEVEWSRGDATGVTRIDDNGTPFRTSGYEGRPLYRFAGDAGWIKPPSD
ncbi:hypothetical protein SRB5_33440 [Streptomyces sp. RB5]|uniref:HTH cro/C1-type domain-containing protein n=1 Tax=Streptomyces smaragdinus TaxID=2585196 RepID=A0A7K0CI94_9ACTN|nr:hypothetical protein [Streptomyces smaragdinus]